MKVRDVLLMTANDCKVRLVDVNGKTLKHGTCLDLFGNSGGLGHILVLGLDSKDDTLILRIAMM